MAGKDVDRENIADFRQVMEFAGLLFFRIIIDNCSGEKKKQNCALPVGQESKPETGLIDAVAEDYLEIVIDDVHPDKAGERALDKDGVQDFMMTNDVHPSVHMTFSSVESPPVEAVEVIKAGCSQQVPLICAACGMQNWISPDVFAEQGCCLQVECSCRHRFFIMREQRRFYRKKVNLKGAFKLASREQFYFSEANWVPSTMTDLSKLGIRFSTKDPGPVKQGDQVLVQFQLDNNNKTLIEKAARIQSINQNQVGCCFEQDGQHDVTLGFYLL
jgi:hypothetical protein